MSHSTSSVSSKSTPSYPLVMQQRAVRSGTVGIINQNNLCGGCKKEIASLQCGMCREISYCSKECQIAAWAAHKKACKIIGASLSKPTSEENTSADAKAYELLQLCGFTQKSHNYEKSIAYAEAALAKKPTDPDLIALLYIVISQARRLQNLYDAATLDVCERALAAKAKDPNIIAQAYMGLAETLIRLGRDEEAFAATQKGIAAKPTKYDIMANLNKYAANSRVNLGLYSDALMHAEFGLSENNQDLSIRADLYFISSSCRLILGQEAEARKDALAGLDAALEAETANPALVDNLNKILARTES